MRTSSSQWHFITIALIALFAVSNISWAQSVGNSGSVNGAVLDPTGAVVAQAAVHLHNVVSGFERTTTTDASGKFSITNVPLNPYHVTVTAAGFAIYAQDVDVRSSVPISLNIGLKVAGSSTAVTVESEAGDLLENDSTFHTDFHVFPINGDVRPAFQDLTRVGEPRLYPRGGPTMPPISNGAAIHRIDHKRAMCWLVPT